MAHLDKHTHNLSNLNEFGTTNQQLSTVINSYQRLPAVTSGYQWTSKLLICLRYVTVTLVNTGRSAPAFWEKNGNMDIVMVIN